MRGLTPARVHDISALTVTAEVKAHARLLHAIEEFPMDSQLLRCSQESHKGGRPYYNRWAGERPCGQESYSAKDDGPKSNTEESTPKDTRRCSHCNGKHLGDIEVFLPSSGASSGSSAQDQDTANMEGGSAVTKSSSPVSGTDGWDDSTQEGQSIQKRRRCHQKSPGLPRPD